VSQELLFSEEVLRAGQASINKLREMSLTCQKCALHKERTKVVFGEGCIDSPPIAFVGEAPGANEDAKGRPFIGRAGELLTRMIEAMGLTRDQIYICNAVCCRPPGNRRPEKEEVDACNLFLVGQLRIVQPKIIVALGASAAQALSNKKKGIGDLRGRWMQWEDKRKGKGIVVVKPVPLRATYHPAYLLRNPNAKGKVWTDLQIVMKWLERAKDDGKDKDNGNNGKAN
jgi:DNA polymerase